MSNTSTFANRRVLEAKPVAAPMPTQAQLLAMIQELQAQNAALKSGGRTIGFKVSEKGCVTMTGTGQYGTTLYATQWAVILDNAPALAAFIRDNATRLSWGKDDKTTQAQRDATRDATLASCQTYLD